MSAANSPASAIAPSPSNSTSINGTPAITPRPNGAQPIAKIVTSKEWVLPPRPKPGRKPSADTPATKRKAQNRAAQRAFRERRATRVSELEGKLSEFEKEREVNELNLKNIINKLQMENKYLIKTLNDVKSEFANFKQSVQQPQQINVNSSHHSSPAVYSNGTVNAPSPLAYFKPSNSNTPNEYRPTPQQYQRPQHQAISPALSKSPNTPAPPSHTPSTTKTSISSATHESNNNYDCGVCVKDDCICEEVGIKPQPQPQQRSLSVIENFKPMAPVSLKRKQIDEVEIDYTSKFSKNPSTTKKPMPKLKKFKKQTVTTRANSVPDEAKEFRNVFDKITDDDFESPMEQCGFCSDDSPCVCREAAKEAASAIAELQNHHKRDSIQQVEDQTLPPIRNGSISTTTNKNSQSSTKLPVLHPGPTVEISEVHRSSISTPANEQAPSTKEENPQKTGGCTGNPGTCTQCQMDPMSTLFCTTIASKAEEEHDKEPSESTTESTSTSGLKKEDKKSPVSPPLSNVSSKVSSPLTVTSQEEELNSLKSKTGTPSSSSSTDSASLNQQKGIFIPCADAYKTLSRHKEFNSVDFSTLVGKLTTRGMQVEVQSVANVLRELDRRLYN